MPGSNTLLNLLTGAPTDPNNPLNLDLSPAGQAALAAETRSDNPPVDPDLNISGGLTSNINGPGTPFSSLPVDVQNSANQADIDWANMDTSYYAAQEQNPLPLVLGALGAIAAPFALSAFGLGGAAAAASGAGTDALAGAAGADVVGATAAAGAAATVDPITVTALAASGMSVPEIAAATGASAAAVAGVLSGGGGTPTNTLPGADAGNTVSGVTVTPQVTPSPAGLTPAPTATLPATNPLAPAPTPDLTNIDPATLPQATDPNAGLTPLPLATAPSSSSSLTPAATPDLTGITPIVAPQTSSTGTPSAAGVFSPTSLIAPAIGAAGTIAGAAVGASAASDAASVEQNIWNQTQANLQPFINAGTGALPQLENLTGTGAGGIAGEEAALQATPGYQFQMDQGLQALLSQSTATGGVGGGNTLKGLLGYSQGLADSTYQEQVNNTYNLATLGENAGAHLGTIGTATGSNIANTLTQGANATTAGITSLTNQLTGFLGTPAGASFLANLGSGGS